MTALETIIRNEKERLSKVPSRSNTKLWWAETKQGQFCFELDDYYEMVSGECWQSTVMIAQQALVGSLVNGCVELGDRSVCESHLS